MSELATNPAVVLPPISATVRPANLRRSLFHVASGFTALALLRLMPSRTALIATAASLAVFAWTLEIGRRRSRGMNELLMRLLGPIAHPEERHRVNSSTWYLTALLMLACFSPLRSAEVAVLVLGIADPIAGFIGRRYGRTKIRARRSLEGTLAFVTAGGLAALAWLSFAYPTLSIGARVGLAAAAAVVGAIAEVASTRADDNFTIPIAAAVATSIAAFAI